MSLIRCWSDYRGLLLRLLGQWREDAVELLCITDVESAAAFVDGHGASGFSEAILSVPEDCDDHGRVVDVEVLSIGF